VAPSPHTNDPRSAPAPGGDRPSGAPSVPIITARGFSKKFGERTVLDSVDLEIQPGEIHALLGQNGSGKSTFIKILAGYHEPEAGAALTVNGTDVALPLAPGAPLKHGIAFVHQDLGLAEDMSVLENVRVGKFATRALWRIPWAQERQRVQLRLEEFGVDVSPDTLVSELSDTERIVVAIVRALDHLEGVERGLLVLDEATTGLPLDGVNRLFAVVRGIADRGFGVLLVTHRLDEVRAWTDRLTVLRDGVLVEQTNTASLSESELIERLLGRTLDELYPEPHSSGGDVLLSVRGLAGSILRDLDLDLRAGEIVGLTGLIGMGHEQVPYLLFGAQQVRAGTATLDGRELALKRMTVADAIGAGLALIPGNRAKLGAVKTATLLENVTLPTLGTYFRGGRLRRRAETEAVDSLLQRFSVVPADAGLELGMLSGGNQQKAVVAKWFATSPRVFLMHEPSQGVDVGARSEIFRHIRGAADAGMAVLIASAEYEDLAHLCDRVLIFRDGHVISELHRGELTSDRIVEQALRDGTAA
jgi:ribose transport system ATP-binding protein